jgi:hypothetical protein
MPATTSPDATSFQKVCEAGGLRVELSVGNVSRPAIGCHPPERHAIAVRPSGAAGNETVDFGINRRPKDFLGESFE